jgi:hypothetical protein
MGCVWKPGAYAELLAIAGKRCGEGENPPECVDPQPRNVIPAKAGIQRLQTLRERKALDPSFRWYDEREAFRAGSRQHD